MIKNRDFFFPIECDADGLSQEPITVRMTCRLSAPDNGVKPIKAQVRDVRTDGFGKLQATLLIELSLFRVI